MLTNLGTSERRTQSTVADGLFSFVTVIPGQYRIEVEKQGFKHVTREPVVVQVQQSTHIDVAMQVGMVSEVVQVTAETPLLQSETSSLGQIVEQRKANELPLNGRNIFNLAAASPGVVPQGQFNDTPVGKNIFAKLGLERLNFQILRRSYATLAVGERKGTTRTDNVTAHQA
jgi:hypothetical protein